MERGRYAATDRRGSFVHLVNQGRDFALRRGLEGAYAMDSREAMEHLIDFCRRHYRDWPRLYLHDKRSGR